MKGFCMISIRSITIISCLSACFLGAMNLQQELINLEDSLNKLAQVLPTSTDTVIPILAEIPWGPKDNQIKSFIDFLNEKNTVGYHFVFAVVKNIEELKALPNANKNIVLLAWNEHSSRMVENSRAISIYGEIMRNADYINIIRVAFSPEANIKSVAYDDIYSYDGFENNILWKDDKVSNIPRNIDTVNAIVTRIKNALTPETSTTSTSNKPLQYPITIPIFISQGIRIPENLIEFFNQNTDSNLFKFKLFVNPSTNYTDVSPDINHDVALNIDFAFTSRIYEDFNKANIKKLQEKYNHVITLALNSSVFITSPLIARSELIDGLAKGVGTRGIPRIIYFNNIVHTKDDVGGHNKKEVEDVTARLKEVFNIK